MNIYIHVLVLFICILFCQNCAPKSSFRGSQRTAEKNNVVTDNSIASESSDQTVGSKTEATTDTPLAVAQCTVADKTLKVGESATWQDQDVNKTCLCKNDGKAECKSDKKYRYYRIVIDSVGITEFYKAVYIREIKLKWKGTWQINAYSGQNHGTIGGLPIVISTRSTADDSGDPCENSVGGCSAYLLFDGVADINHGYVSTYNVFSGEPPYDALVKDNEYVQIDFGDSQIELEAFQIFGWPSGGAPDAFHVTVSNDAKNWVELAGSRQNTDTTNAEPITELPKVN